ncbi:MAG: Arc family DNA-binding protein [Luteolibacter sp.]|jgi:plasmid stability protein|nr:Arc family DNA-binding protein [Luteolibacter sp.]
MSATLTIRNLPEPVKQRLRMQAASHGRSMEAEAREILAVGLAKESGAIMPPRSKEELRERLLAVTGIWKDRYEGKSTDEWMKELRGDD